MIGSRKKVSKLERNVLLALLQTLVQSELKSEWAGLSSLTLLDIRYLFELDGDQPST